jgi:cohesin loading factor subunit SCC2
MSELSIIEMAPSFVQSLLGLSYPQGNPQPYTEYASEVECLSAFELYRKNTDYWESTRGDVLGLLQDSTSAGLFV